MEVHIHAVIKIEMSATSFEGKNPFEMVEITLISQSPFAQVNARPTKDVITLYMPLEMKKRIEFAAAAFNAVMNEAEQNVRAFPQAGAEPDNPTQEAAMLIEG